MALIRFACAVYGLVLTVLLLAPDPLALLGIHRLPGPPGGRMVHFVAFTLLALLVCASRWPVRRGLLAGLLVGYAMVTEVFQVFVPPRTVELLDLIENLLGLAAGGAIWCLIQSRFPGAIHRREGKQDDVDLKCPKAGREGPDGNGR